MTTPDTIGREPRTIVEIEQPRCALRFGVGDCSATGAPKCYNTYSTCPVKADYDGTASIRWRFGMDHPDQFADGDFSDPDAIITNTIPTLVNVSTSESKLNPGANLDGKSPFGVTARATVAFADFPWNDIVGDHYLADRSWYQAGKAPEYRSTFWRLFSARNKFLTGMFLHIYDGYVGQDISAMRRRVYVVDKIDGPNETGAVSVTGLDPLRLTDDKRAEFPPTSNLAIIDPLDTETTTVRLFGDGGDLSQVLGNSGEFMFRVGDEFITYTGFTTDADGNHTLTGVVRAVDGTVAEEHDTEEKVQRCGVYRRQLPWVVADDLLRNHTPMPAEFLDLDAWNAEGGTYLPTSFVTRILSEPQPVKGIIGRLCQQSLIYIWWAEYERTIKMLAVRPPDTAPVTLTDSENLLDGTSITTDPAARLTRVAVYYGLKDQRASRTAPANYSNRYVITDSETEGVVDDPVTKSIFADWVTLRTQAAQVGFRLLARYKETPRFVGIIVDAKDRGVSVGSVLDIETQDIVDSEGNIDVTRWQVTSAKEMKAGHSYVLDLQTFTFAGKFGFYMADGSPDYTSATEEQKATGAFYAGADGLMSDGSEGYQYQ